MTHQVRTVAERQAADRQRRPTAGKNSKRRLNMWATTGAAFALARLARHKVVAHRAMLERLIIEADRKTVSRLAPGSAEQDARFAATA